MRMETEQPIIEVRNLVKDFGSLRAVNGVSFSVAAGETFGILGPNGAGKTTTLEMVETLQKPTSGQIMVDGFDVARDAWQVKRRIGIQLQSATFYPELTLVEQLGMSKKKNSPRGGRLRGEREEREWN